MSKEEIKRMPVSEFRRLGYLQELNRCFLHPIGLAIEVICHEDGTENFGGVWDYRDDKEGIRYGLVNSDADKIKKFADNKNRIDAEIDSRRDARKSALGYFIEPVPITVPDVSNTLIEK